MVVVSKGEVMSEPTRWDLVYKWSTVETQSLVDKVVSALENCDAKLTAEQEARANADQELREALVAMVGHYEDTTRFDEEPCLVNARKALERTA